MNRQRNSSVLSFLAVAAIAGCDALAPGPDQVAAVESVADPEPVLTDEAIDKAVPDADRKSQPASDEVRFEVVGVYRRKDTAFVRKQLEDLLKESSGVVSWSASGNYFRYKASFGGNVKELAKKIDFGRSVQVSGHDIRVIYRYDNNVPEVPVEKQDTIFNQSPEDPLGPALEKHDGDWWKALEELRFTRGRNDQGAITRLDLPSFTTTDETLEHVAELESLEDLKLTLARHVTDDGARHLEKLTNLKSLQLFGCSIGDPGQKHLSNLTELKFLTLSGNGTEHGLRHISNLTKLESLSVGFGIGYPVTTTGLNHLRPLKRLKKLRLDGCEISDDGLAIIAEFPKLESLRMRGGIMTNSGLVHLAQLSNLKRLELDECEQIGDAGIAHLAGLKNLTFLSLSHTDVSDGGLNHLQGLSNLGYLDLGHSSVTDAGLKYLPALAELYNLSLQETQISGSGVKDLRPLAGLKYLDLDGTALTDDSLQHLTSFPELTRLSVADTPITDEGLKHLGQLTQLRSLSIGGTKITDAGLASLSRMQKLYSLDISDTAVTNAGLQHLAGLDKLNDIDIDDTAISPEQLQEFRAR